MRTFYILCSIIKRLFGYFLFLFIKTTQYKGLHMFTINISWLGRGLKPKEKLYIILIVIKYYTTYNFDAYARISLFSNMKFRTLMVSVLTIYFIAV
jgi:hypothetical protein